MSNKNSALVKFLMLVLVTPFFVSLPVQADALTVDELTAQLKSLLAQVTALQEQSQATQVLPTIGSSQSDALCPTLFRALSNGIRGDDVQSLQEFLIAQGHLSSGLATGYFGPVTRAAVQRLQLTFGIFPAASDEASGYGVVGPRTRAEIALRCATSSSGSGASPARTCPLAQPPTSLCSTGWRANTDSAGCVTSYKCAIALPTIPLQSTSTLGACTAIALLCPSGTHDEVGPNCSHACVSGATPLSSVLFATPTAGQVPLLVTFTLSATDSTGSSGVYYTVDFGDGQATSFARTAAPSLLHTYTSAGTYNVTVTRRTGCSSWECLGSSTIVGATTVVVNGTSGVPPFSISSPTSGQSVRQGEGLAISWDSQNAPAGSAVALWLVKSNGTNAGLIARNQVTNGTFSWQVPGPQCNSSGVCIVIADSPYANYADVGTYWVVGKIYSPVDAYLGGFPPANPVTPTFFATVTSSLFNITAGENWLACPAVVYPDPVCPAGQHVERRTNVGGCPAPSVCVPDSGSTFSASPSSGTAPLTVTVTQKQLSSWCAAPSSNGLILRPADLGYTAIDFGDGSAVERFDDCAAEKIHTYQKAGSYTIQTWGYGGFLPPGYLVQKKSIATISVGNGTTVPSCPQYMPPLCSASQHLVGGAYNSSTGCYGAPQCVAN